MVLPKVRHLMRQGGKALLVGAAFEVRRIQHDLIGDLRAVLRSEPAAGEQPDVEEIERPILRGIGFRGRIGGGHGSLLCIARKNNRAFLDYMKVCLHAFMLGAALATCFLSKADARVVAGASVAVFL